ncbi:MAG: phosphate transport system permease protein [Actinomycetota bacterium]
MITTQEPKVSEPREIVVTRRFSDKAFRSILILGGLFAFIALSGIFGYLFITSLPVLQYAGISFFTDSFWFMGDNLLPNQGSIDSPQLGIFAMLWGSILISSLALLIAVPISVGLALAITHFFPKFLSRSLTFVVDLVAAVPSIIFGLWGAYTLAPHAQLWAKWLNTNLSETFPIFAVDFQYFGQSPFMAGIVLAIMIIPIITSVAREIYGSVPRDLITGAQALGASRWTMIKNVVIPFGASGVVGGAMLGLGRALGETVAVFFVLNLVTGDVNWFNILESEGGSVASFIISRFGEASPLEVQALFGAGLALFVLTLVTNALATLIVNKARRRR